MGSERGEQPNGLLNFVGKTVVLTGTSSGMGAEALRMFSEADANVHAIDIVEPSNGAANDITYHRCDLGDRQQIDQTTAALPGGIDVLVNCAGVPNGGRFTGRQVMQINWLGLRHLTESLLPRMDDGGSVVHIASTAGRDWSSRTGTHGELMAAATFDEGMGWLDSNEDVVGDGYVLSKEAVQYYTLWRSVQLLPRGIRMNSVCPGITDTQIIGDFRKGMGEQVIDHAAAVAGRFADPSELVPAMMFLADNHSSSYINGVNLNIDRGTGAARASDQADPAVIWGSATAD